MLAGDAHHLLAVLQIHGAHATLGRGQFAQLAGSRDSGSGPGKGQGGLASGVVTGAVGAAGSGTATGHQEVPRSANCSRGPIGTQPLLGLFPQSLWSVHSTYRPRHPVASSCNAAYSSSKLPARLPRIHPELDPALPPPPGCPQDTGWHGPGLSLLAFPPWLFDALATVKTSRSPKVPGLSSDPSAFEHSLSWAHRSAARPCHSPCFPPLHSSCPMLSRKPPLIPLGVGTLGKVA